MLIRSARFVASATSYRQLPPPAFAELAFAGRSNVGKSSLINDLVQRRKLVRTSSTPGCTRAINIFRVELKEPEACFDLVDLPGYGFARRSKTERRSWGVLIENFLEHRPGLRGVVLIIDVRRGLQDDDRELIEFLQHLDRSVVLVATKLDKLPSSKQRHGLKQLEDQVDQKLYGYSATKGIGREALSRAVLRTLAIGRESELASSP
ncbi:MAG: ribosome biogenesis GTP-binding protein YihA/YsxC [Myxococcota bacterium]